MAHRNSHKSTIKNVIGPKMWNMYTDFSDNVLFLWVSPLLLIIQEMRKSRYAETLLKKGVKKQKTLISYSYFIKHVQGYRCKLRLQTLFCQSYELNTPDLNMCENPIVHNILFTDQNVCNCNLLMLHVSVTCVFLLQRQ